MTLPTLRPAGSAWVSTWSGVTLRLEALDWPRCAAPATAELWARDHYWIGAADWALRAERHHAAAVFAQGDEDLERTARRAIHRAALALRLVRVEEQFEAGVRGLEEQDSAEDDSPALLVEGLDRAGSAVVLRVARRCGARVRRRRRA